ncbi:hypothetical protein V8F06_008998 [Rhypophila decipiens]
MQFSTAVAAIVLMATTALATPVADPNTTVIYGTLVADNMDAPPADAELIFSELGVEGEVAKRSYMGTCDYCHIEHLGGADGDMNLVCECKAKNGDWRKSSLNLNYCVANANGQLGSCVRDVQWYYNALFAAKCNPNRNYWTNTINLDERVHNYDGILVCEVPT